MGLFLKYLIQLILSPGNAWEDLAHDDPEPEALLHEGYYPLLGVASATAFFGMLYHGAGLSQVLVTAMAIFGIYFVAVYIGKLLFGLYFECTAGVELDRRRAMQYIISGLGLMLLFQIVENLLPWNLLILKLMPIYIIVVLSKGSGFLGAGEVSHMRLTALAGATLVVIPMVIYYFILMLI